MAYQPTWKERLEDARPYVGPAVAVLIVVAMLGWTSWWYLERRKTPAPEAIAATSGEPAARVRALVAASEALEREALRAQEAGQLVTAMEKGREAWQRQREANELASSPELKDSAREARLLAAIEQLNAEPLRATVAVGRSLATAALARESWSDAAKALSEARAAQAELNARFPNSPLANRGALGEIDAQIASMLVAKAQARERAGDAAVRAGRAQEAAMAFAQAGDAWQEVEERALRVTQNPAARREELATKRETALAAAPLANVAALEREIAVALRMQRVELAVKKVAEANALLEQTARTLPRGLAAAAEMRRKLAFLSAHAADLSAWQREILAEFVPLAGPQGPAIFRTEISQGLYTRIMSVNPSRNPGAALPVDSVSWHEARACCERISWLLGRVVRLPTENEFRAARFGISEISWSAENAGDRSQPVGGAPGNKAAIRDLAGNVAEWLEPAPQATEDSAPVAGGSYLDRAEALVRTPIVTLEKRARARHVGFRIVAEAPE